MPPTLSEGSAGFDVAVMQVQLNSQGDSTPKLKVDGTFGPLTRDATIAFQVREGLAPDGVAGPLTHERLKRGIALRVAKHDIALIPQPTQPMCWAASTAMMTHSNIQDIIRKTPLDMIASDGGLKNSSSTDQAVVTGTRYGSIHGLHCYSPMSWSVPAFVTLLERSPLMIDMLWNSWEYARGKGSPGHIVVVAAVISDNDPTGKGTHLQILDPWPPSIGNASWADYWTWIKDVPTRTYRVFDRDL